MAAKGIVEGTKSTTPVKSPKPPWKRVRKPFRSQRQANTAYYNTVSKLYLTKRTLMEFDRRDSRIASYEETPAGGTALSEEPAALQEFSDQIKRFARQGGPDICDLRWYPEPPSETVPSSTDTPSIPKVRKSKRNSSAFDAVFRQHLVDYGIHPSSDSMNSSHGTDHVPDNWDELQHMIAKPRPSLSPSQFSDGAFETIYNATMTSEYSTKTIFPMIKGDSDIPSAARLTFDNLLPLTDGTILDARPDFYDGAHPTQTDGQLQEELGPYIIPTTQQQAPTLPNFFAKIQGSNVETAKSSLEACYNGVMGARGIQKIRLFGADDDELPEDEKAYTFSSIYSNGMLSISAIYPTPSTSEPDDPDYRIVQLDCWALEDSREDFVAGAGALRNARDWAQAQRDRFIAAANARLPAISEQTSPGSSSDYLP